MNDKLVKLTQAFMKFVATKKEEALQDYFKTKHNLHGIAGVRLWSERHSAHWESRRDNVDDWIDTFVVDDVPQFRMTTIMTTKPAISVSCVVEKLVKY